MVRSSRKTEKVTLRYPRHAFRPEELLNFIELRAFTSAWDHDLGLTDEDLTALQILIMIRPKGAPVIAGTDGLRKLRFSPPGAHEGKSGGIRVCYVYFEEFGIVLLVAAYSKHRKDDLTDAQRKTIRRLIHSVREELERVQNIR
jgi:hypothetical protein